jgi:hypothetical protein
MLQADDRCRGGSDPLKMYPAGISTRQIASVTDALRAGRGSAGCYKAHQREASRRAEGLVGAVFEVEGYP